MCCGLYLFTLIAVLRDVITLEKISMKSFDKLSPRLIFFSIYICVFCVKSYCKYNLCKKIFWLSCLRAK
jgi:hypothetical protein